MKLLKQLCLLDRLDQLIRMKATGTPSQLANRLDVSERTVYNLIGHLKSLGAEIAYSRDRMSFIYENEILFSFQLVIKKEDKKKVKGGNFFLEYQTLLQIFCRGIG